MEGLTNKSASDLQRVIQEATGWQVSIMETRLIWLYVVKFLRIKWEVRKPSPYMDQSGLFDS
jgi:hypothetical protein